MNRSIKDLIDRMGYRDRIDEQSAVVYWERIVGDKIASVTDPKSIKNGIIRVKVKNPAWRQELIFLKEDIRKKLNTELNGNIVSDIIFS